MGLKIRTFDAIFQDGVDWITARTDRITDFNVGSAIRTLLEAVAIQLEEFYFAVKQYVLYAIETAIYDAFGFPIREAQNAIGSVTVEFRSPLPDGLTIRKGTIFCTSRLYGSIYFESTEDVRVPAGSLSVLVPVRCRTDGELGNVPAGAITTLTVTNSMVSRVYNQTAFTSGSGIETPAERKRRFQHYIKTLAKGTRDALIYGTLEVEGVAGAWCDDRYIGIVKLYAHDADGNLSDDLKKAIIRNLQNYRSAGIEVQVLPIVKRPLDISVMVMIGNEYDAPVYDELIKELLDRMLNEHTVSEPFYVANMIHVIKDSYEDVVINIKVLEGRDTEVGDNEIIRAGEVKVHCVTEKDWREY